ncbi:MAG: TetR/AcrR family transcriptional regulator [Gemmatimonadales bacterium]
MTQRRKRGYRSPRRDAAAAVTRAKMIVAARWLFTHRGYAATTIAAIARRAGTAVPTFYAVFGSKRGVLFALLDEMSVEADAGRLARDIAAARDDPRRQLAARIAFTTRFYQRGADILQAVRMAGDAEPDLAALWRQGERRRREREAPVLDEWIASGALRPGLDPADAADRFWALSGPDVYRLFVVECGWAPIRFEAWLVELLATELFGPQRTGRRGSRGRKTRGGGT